MIASPATILAVRVGAVRPLGPRATPSGFVKHAVTAPVAVDTAGLAGDGQADRRVHGAPDKAVYAYPVDAYARWRAHLPHHDAQLMPGSMGENLVVAGLGDDDVALGDVVRIGSAVLQVTEPRQPCYKLGLAFGDAAMVRAFAQVGVSGWYYRVLEAGTIAAGDSIKRVARPNPGWTVARLFALIVGGTFTPAELIELAGLEGASAKWRAKAARRAARVARSPVGPEGFEPPTKPL